MNIPYSTEIQMEEYNYAVKMQKMQKAFDITTRVPVSIVKEIVQNISVEKIIAWSVTENGKEA